MQSNKTSFLLSGLIMTILGLSMHALAEQADHRVYLHYPMSDPPWAAVTHAEGLSRADVRVVIALWPGGRLVWSADEVRGGAPFQEGQVSRDGIRHFRQTLEESGVLTNENLRKTLYSKPESDVTEINLYERDRWIVGSLPETPYMQARSDLGPEEAQRLQQQVPEYQYAWGQVREALHGLIGQATDARVSDIDFHVDWVHIRRAP